MRWPTRQHTTVHCRPTTSQPLRRRGRNRACLPALVQASKPSPPTCPPTVKHLAPHTHRDLPKGSDWQPGVFTNLSRSGSLHVDLSGYHRGPRGYHSRDAQYQRPHPGKLTKHLWFREREAINVMILIASCTSSARLHGTIGFESWTLASPARGLHGRTRGTRVEFVSRLLILIAPTWGGSVRTCQPDPQALAS